jgi:hypothetical protein
VAHDAEFVPQPHPASTSREGGAGDTGSLFGHRANRLHRQRPSGGLGQVNSSSTLPLATKHVPRHRRHRRMSWPIRQRHHFVWSSPFIVGESHQL